MLPLIPPKLPQAPDRRGRSEDSTVKLFERIQRGERERRSFRDRRASPRITVELDVHTDDGDARLVQVTHDLSTFGVSLKTGPTPQVGTRLKLRLCLPDEQAEPITLRAEVLGAFDAHGGARLKFIKPPLDAVRRIHRFLK